MNPDKCDDFRPDVLTPDDCTGQRGQLIEHLSLSWRTECIERLVRYNEKEIEEVVYNGWAMWRKQ